MKQFKNRVTEVIIPDESKSTETKMVSKPATFADLALICVRAPKKDGFGVEEMRKRFRIIDVLEAAGDTAIIKLEDQDALELQTIIAEFKWSAMHKEIIELIDTIAKMKDTKK